MAHFAHVQNGIVLKVHVVHNSMILDENGEEQEHLGQQYLASLHGYDTQNLIQCSYNGNFRGRYPGTGFRYDAELDEFLPPVIEIPEA